MKDETMHSGTDVEAFTAELNRDIEGSVSTSQQQEQPSHSDAAISSQSRFLSQWQTSSLDGNANFQNRQDLMAMEENEQQHSSQVDLQKHGSDSQNRKEDDNSYQEPNSLLHNPSVDARPQPQDERNTFSFSQPMGTQTSAKQPINIQGLDHEPNPEKESQMDKKVQNINHHLSMPMRSNDQQTLPMDFKDQQSLSTGKGNQLTNMEISTEQFMAPVNQHITGMMMSSQHATTSGMSNQQSMTNTNKKLNNQFPIDMLLGIIKPQLNKDRTMQLNTLCFKLKKKEICVDDFFRYMRSIVGDLMLRMAVEKLKTQAARNSQTAPNQFQSQPRADARKMQVPPNAQLPTDLNTEAKSREVESQADSQGAQVSQMSNSSSGALSHDRKHPVFPRQVLSKQQHMQLSKISLPAYGSAGSSNSPFPPTNAASSTSIRAQSHDWQPPSHPNMAVNHLGPTSRAMNITNMSKIDRSHPLSDPKKMPAGSLIHMNDIALQQNQTHVKQDLPDQSNEQHKAQLSSSQPCRTGFAPPTSLVPAISVSNPVPSPMETNILITYSRSRISSLTYLVGLGINSKTPPKKPLVGQNKLIEAPGSSPLSSKKQKVSGAFLDQSIEHHSDVTAISGINLREEEEQLLSGPKEDSRISEASRRVVQEEEQRLMLQKIPLQKKLMEIMAKCGLKNMSNDMEKCLSLCVEERMRVLISNIIRLSKQRVDIEKPRHKTIITSDVRQQITKINRKALEEWEKKQAETKKSQKLNEPESSTGDEGDKDKDDNRARSTKVNKEEEDKMRTTSANSAVRAAIGVGDMLQRWQLMEKQGGCDTSSISQTGKDVGRNLVTTSTRNTRESQEPEMRDALATPASVRKVGRNQVVAPRVARIILIEDVIAVLEREPQMSKSSLLYRLYQKASTDATGE